MSHCSAPKTDPILEEITSRITQASSTFPPGGMVLPVAIEPHVRTLEDFYPKLGNTVKDPHFGWFQGIPVYRSHLSTKIVVF